MTTKRKRLIRTEELGINFSNGFADGWAFDVSEAFKQNLDISLIERIDKAKNTEKQRQLGRKLEKHEKIKKTVWTRGNPPAYSFAEGHIFYDPPGVRSMIWGDALKVLRRTVQVMRATPDPGALIMPGTIDEDDAEATEPMTAPDTGGPGLVAFEVLYYQSGEITRSEIKELSQRDFADFLWMGVYPPSIL